MAFSAPSGCIAFGIIRLRIVVPGDYSRNDVAFYIIHSNLCIGNAHRRVGVDVR
jgi:hypothetical protein